MAVNKITPEEYKASRESMVVDGQRWHYLDVAPLGERRGTVFLIHGFPDHAFGWRYQIPMLCKLGLRCIALECMGYGDTGTSSDLRDFGFKKHADAVAGIAKQIGANKIIIGGHDWGGAVVWRVSQWYPDLVTHVFSVCTPYFKVFDQYTSTEDLIKGGVKQFGYQLQFGSPDQKVEKVVKDETTIRKFLLALYGGKAKSGKPLMTPENGVDLDLIEHDEIAMTPLMSEEEFNFYVQEYMKNGINGPCNWYRTRKVNYEDEVNLPSDQRKGVKQPTLFIQALKENILTDDLTRGMEKAIPNLTREAVPASHWALWHTPKETNDIIQKWFEGVVFGGKSKL